MSFMVLISWDFGGHCGLAAGLYRVIYQGLAELALGRYLHSAL